MIRIHIGTDLLRMLISIINMLSLLLLLYVSSTNIVHVFGNLCLCSEKKKRSDYMDKHITYVENVLIVMFSAATNRSLRLFLMFV